MTIRGHLFLQVRDITVCYGAVAALKKVSFEVYKEEIVAMIGPNGAGKSTALKAVSGLLQASGGFVKEGEIIFEGQSIKDVKTHELVEKGIILVPEGRRIFPTMTVLENLEMGAYTISDQTSVKDSIDKALNMFPQLGRKIAQKAGNLSTGEQQMLALGRALMRKPKLLLADEPSLGLSPNFVDFIFDKLIEINKTGTSILLVEQNALMSLEICHRGYLFERGTIAIKGGKAALLNDDRIKDSFLGKSSS
ncbi:MAG TPA: ABC transporter ATP-binding protein [Pyrinomonadaceae bacterium]|jgi:branched-chain amino acid transport system ATP-binding protein